MIFQKKNQHQFHTHRLNKIRPSFVCLFFNYYYTHWQKHRKDDGNNPKHIPAARQTDRLKTEAQTRESRLSNRQNGIQLHGDSRGLNLH